jgi:hypothetical protein
VNATDADVQRRVLPVEVAPLEREQLGGPHAGPGGKQDRGGEHVTAIVAIDLRGDLDEPVDLLPCQRCDAPAALLGLLLDMGERVGLQPIGLVAYGVVEHRLDGVEAAGMLTAEPFRVGLRHVGQPLRAVLLDEDGDALHVPLVG